VISEERRNEIVGAIRAGYWNLPDGFDIEKLVENVAREVAFEVELEPKPLLPGVSDGEVDFKKLVELRIESTKQSVVYRLNCLGGTVGHIKESLCGKNYEPESAGKTENYAYQLLDHSLLVDIGRLNALVEIYKEMFGARVTSG